MKFLEVPRQPDDDESKSDVPYYPLVGYVESVDKNANTISFAWTKDGASGIEVVSWKAGPTVRHYPSTISPSADKTMLPLIGTVGKLWLSEASVSPAGKKGLVHVKDPRTGAALGGRSYRLPVHVQSAKVTALVDPAPFDGAQSSPFPVEVDVMNSEYVDLAASRLAPPGELSTLSLSADFMTKQLKWAFDMDHNVANAVAALQARTPLPRTPAEQAKVEEQRLFLATAIRNGWTRLTLDEVLAMLLP